MSAVKWTLRGSWCSQLGPIFERATVIAFHIITQFLGVTWQVRSGKIFILRFESTDEFEYNKNIASNGSHPSQPNQRRLGTGAFGRGFLISPFVGSAKCRGCHSMVSTLVGPAVRSNLDSDGEMPHKNAASHPGTQCPGASS